MSWLRFLEICLRNGDSMVYGILIRIQNENMVITSETKGKIKYLTIPLEEENIYEQWKCFHKYRKHLLLYKTKRGADDRCKQLSERYPMQSFYVFVINNALGEFQGCPYCGSTTVEEMRYEETPYRAEFTLDPITGLLIQDYNFGCGVSTPIDVKYFCSECRQELTGYDFNIDENSRTVE